MAAEVAVALLRGLADEPGGPHRAKTCASRRAEVMVVAGQILHVLDETERCLEERCLEGSSSSELELCAGRLRWASNMAAGLQQGAVALKLMEEADLSCDNVIAAKQPFPPADQAEYDRIESLLSAYQERIRHMANCLSACLSISKAGPSRRPGDALRSTQPIVHNLLKAIFDSNCMQSRRVPNGDNIAWTWMW